MPMNMNALLPLIIGMNGNGNMNEILIKMLTDSANGSDKKLDPMTIMALALMSNMNRNDKKSEKSSSEKIDEKIDDEKKTPNLSAIENLSNDKIIEILKMMINNQKK